MCENLISDNFSNKVVSICDVGSGAGFPGVVMAILNIEKKLNIKMVCIDSNSKKIEFLKHLVKALGLKIRIINSRVEEIEEKFDIILARAVAPLYKLFNYLENVSKNDTTFLLPKGKNWVLETYEIKKKWHYDLNVVKNNTLIDKSGGVTLMFRNVTRKK